MTTNPNKKNNFIIHPILLSIYPILHLYSHNQDIAEFAYLPRPLLLALLTAFLVFLLAWVLVKNKIKAALICSLFILLFFLFGAFISIVPHYLLKSIFTNAHWPVLFMFLLLFIAGGFLIAKEKKYSFEIANFFLNSTSIILIIIITAGIGLYEYKKNQYSYSLQNENLSAINMEKELPPDIYYIVLDGYGRQDILEEIYGFNNSQFINHLTDTGFYVAKNSQANYAQTYQSMSSSLNFKYINYLAKPNKELKMEWARKPYRDLIRNNIIAGYLKENGYLLVSLPASWGGLENNIPADLRFFPSQLNINEFERILINKTPFRLFLNQFIHLDFAKKILSNFDYLPEVANLNSPTFVYAHILSPHPPFIFDKQGQKTEKTAPLSGLDGSHYLEFFPSPEDYRKQYVEQLIFINKKTIEMIDGILKNAPKPPVIILQSDHGPGSQTDWENAEKTNMRERFSILNAYYLPENCHNYLYDSITPVNSFRVVFNCLFGADLDLLEDKSYFSLWDTPFDFIDVSEVLAD